MKFLTIKTLKFILTVISDIIIFNCIYSLIIKQTQILIYENIIEILTKIKILHEAIEFLLGLRNISMF